MYTELAQPLTAESIYDSLLGMQEVADLRFKTIDRLKLELAVALPSPFPSVCYL